MTDTTKTETFLLYAAITACILTISVTSGCKTAPATPPAPLPTDPATLKPNTLTTAPLPASPLTLSDAIKRAIECSSEITRLQNTLESVTDSLTEELRDPELRLSYGEDSTTVNRNRWTTPGNSTTTGNADNDSSAYRLAVRFFLPNIWTHSSKDLQQKAAYNAAAAELKAEKQKITADTRLAFAKIRHLEKTRSLARLLVKLHANKQKQVDKLTESGSLSAIDNIEFSRRYLKTLSNLTRIEISYNNEIKSLANTLCLPADSLEFASEKFKLLQVDTSDAGIAELQALMMQNRSDLAALGWRRITAEASLKTQQREHLPWIRHVQMSYGGSTGTSTGTDTTTEPMEPTEYGYRDDDADSDEWAVTTAINIPLYGLDSSKRRLLTTKIQQAEKEENAKTERAKYQLREACRSLRTQNQLRKQHKIQTQPVINKIKKALSSSNTASNLTFKEQIRMYEDLADAKRLELELDFNYRAALIKLDKTLGLPLFHLAATNTDPK